ncbi:MAG TPA: glycosyltransferase family 1 protein, partial [Candidatus Gracilibacteria bacterium]|nr:glycosyltransferase family 1 protein [Candidatus Gracilibacteria bacterium]
TLEPRKNISRLVEGYKLFAKKHPRAGIKLVLAGKTNTSVFSNFRIDKDENIILPGFIDDKDKPLLYEMAEAFVYPSLFEGFGLPLLEALKCGTPIITSDRSSMPEVVGDAALLVNPENSTAIAGALEKILQHDVRSALRRKMAERIKLFSWKKTAKQTLEVLNS